MVPASSKHTGVQNSRRLKLKVRHPRLSTDLPDR